MSTLQKMVETGLGDTLSFLLNAEEKQTDGEIKSRG